MFRNVIIVTRAKVNVDSVGYHVVRGHELT